MKATSKPARAMRAAERASWHAGITTHRRSDRALDSNARSLAAGVVVMSKASCAQRKVSRRAGAHGFNTYPLNARGSRSLVAPLASSNTRSRTGA
eukprot:scaffold23009_cov56-Phaeocystis_antarctica.AAC.1